MNGGKKMEDNKYEQVIARYNDTQLMHAETILRKKKQYYIKRKKQLKKNVKGGLGNNNGLLRFNR